MSKAIAKNQLNKFMDKVTRRYPRIKPYLPRLIHEVMAVASSEELTKLARHLERLHQCKLARAMVQCKCIYEDGRIAMANHRGLQINDKCGIFTKKDCFCNHFIRAFCRDSHLKELVLRYQLEVYNKCCALVHWDQPCEFEALKFFWMELPPGVWIGDRGNEKILWTRQLIHIDLDEIEDLL